MTQERFAQIIEDPALLRRISYEELKTLALAYPYAHNLRTLLALKSSQIDHPDALRNLATAAAYGLDRTKLFLLIAPQVIVPQQILAPEEVLELKPIETVKRELEALSPVVVREEKNLEAMPPVEVMAATVSPVNETSKEEPRDELPSSEALKTEIEPSGSAPDLDDFGENELVELNPAESIEVSTASIAPVRQTFSEWIGNFRPPVLVTRAAPAIIPEAAPFHEERTEESIKTSGIAQQLAERSVAENQDVISETLAKLYAKQGYRDKSAQMYARLALLFPEKSAYFAAEIDKLKK
ncbi:MAG: hypothetical protein ACKVT2_18850 [Saprospiraceae bacterium]